MPLNQLQQEGYYKGSQTLLGNGTETGFVLSTSNFETLPVEEGEFNVYIDNILQDNSTYTYTSPTLTFSAAPSSGSVIMVELIQYDTHYGNYQNIKLKDIVTNFTVSYVGEDKIISKIKRADVLFHAQRAVQELNYDTLRSNKSQEIEIPPSLTMPLPHDYVNYTKVSWSDSSGIERIIYPTRKTSNPAAILQDSDYNYIFDSSTGELMLAENSEKWKKYKSEVSTESTNDQSTRDLELYNAGGRFGLEPEFAQGNGVFFIDQLKGLIHFSSSLTGKIITLNYISDGLNTNDITVHKFAEEAIYKHVAYAILSTRINIQEYIIRRFKKERFAEIRKAKLRLSNLKSEELAQIMRGKSKINKH